MSYESNNGTLFLAPTCGVASSGGINIQSNNRTGYLYNPPNDFILWGQNSTYTHSSSNNGTQYYFLKCNVPSSAGLNLQSNNSTKYYFDSDFNCVSFCV